MKISLEWLGEYVDLPSVEELASRLTFAGLEVEAIIRPPEGVRVGQILASNPHPSADKLSVTSVDFGAGPTQIVCGAKNYKVGDKVPVATVGAQLPNGVEIKKAVLRGVESSGMLCSARELSISDEHEGLMILPKDAPLGAPVWQVVGVTFELNVTPNRADALCHLGVARDVAALMGKAVRVPKAALSESSAEAKAAVSVRVEDSARCLRYAARVIENVKVGPSPAWMERRLKACGVRAINNLVDVTNYVMLEYGQPLHAFDLDKIAGAQIVVRAAKASERLTTLDGKERTLSADDLLICDRDRPLAIAGVMGGATSEVTPTTTRVLLECATFHSPSVRRTSKRHALHTESSHRFERGTDIDAVPSVLDRAAALIAELGGGTVSKGQVDVYPKPRASLKIQLRSHRVAELLGVEVAETEIARILNALGFNGGAGGYEVPAYRTDVTQEEDLIEEVARIRGYDQIPIRMPKGLGTLSVEKPSTIVERKVRAALAGQGVDEVINYSFVAPATLQAFKAAEPSVKLSNPLSLEQSVMRTTLFASLVPNVVHNVRHQALGVRLYEWGKSYRPDPDGGKDRKPVAHETREVAGVLWGIADKNRSWTGKGAAVDFFDLKGVVEALLTSLQIAAECQPLESAWYHPRASAQLVAKGEVLGSLGELHPKVAKSLDAPAGIFLFQLEVEKLLKVSRLLPQASALSPFPSVRRDLAVVVKSEVPQAAIEQLILEIGRPLLCRARVFDVYSGSQLAAGTKNVAFALEYQSKEKTLTDDEVKVAHQRIVEEVQKRLGGALRA